jgi:hypothetical protein
MTGRRGRELEQWMTAATGAGEPALSSFVTGLRADQGAVTAGRAGQAAAWRGSPMTDRRALSGPPFAGRGTWCKRPYLRGRTCLCNTGPKCRHDHRLKQHPSWHVDQLPDGTFRWTTPAGRTYITEPTRYPI